MAIYQLRGDELDITDWEATKLEILSFRDDNLDMMTKKGESDFRDPSFRGDKLDMID